MVHPQRPEWGQGVVRQASVIQHDGESAQRVVIDFVHHKRVTINTAFVSLQFKGAEVPMTESSSTVASNSQGWLGSLGEQAGKGLWELPEAMTDPFASLANRLQATLDSYRFSTEARSLIDWAVTQTGLTDPLSQFTRHELEQVFPRYERDRDQHLAQLVSQIKKKGKAEVLGQTMQQTRHEPARQALKKAMRR